MTCQVLGCPNTDCPLVTHWTCPATGATHYLRPEPDRRVGRTMIYKMVCTGCGVDEQTLMANGQEAG